MLLQVKDAVDPPTPGMLDQVQERLGLKAHEPTLSERVDQHITSMRSAATSGMEALSSAAASAAEPEAPSTFDKVMRTVGLKSKPSTVTERAKSNMQQQAEQLKDSASKLHSNIASSQETIGNSLSGAASQVASSMGILQQEASAGLDAGVSKVKTALGADSSVSNAAAAAADSAKSSLDEVQVLAAQRLDDIKQAIGYKRSSTAKDAVDDGLTFAEHAYQSMKDATKDMNRRVHEQLHGAKEGRTTSFNEVERSLSAKMQESKTQAEKQLNSLRAKVGFAMTRACAVEECTHPFPFRARS